MYIDVTSLGSRYCIASLWALSHSPKKYNEKCSALWAKRKGIGNINKKKTKGIGNINKEKTKPIEIIKTETRRPGKKLQHLMNFP
jgi:hypothetical protein